MSAHECQELKAGTKTEDGGRGGRLGGSPLPWRATAREGLPSLRYGAIRARVRGRISDFKFQRVGRRMSDPGV